MKKTDPQSGPLSRNYTRRKFISSAAAAAGLFQIVPRHVIAGSGQTPPSEKLNVAVVGLGWMGKLNLKACSNENIVALCDVDHDFAAEAFQEHPKAAVYKDYRVMLEQQKDVKRLGQKNWKKAVGCIAGVVLSSKAIKVRSCAAFTGIIPD